MREDLEQQEQMDAIKGFWNDNKSWIVPLLGFLVIAAISFNVWTWHTQRQARLATDALTALETALAEQSLEKARVAHQVLAADFSSSTQAALGGLQMAKVLLAAGDLVQAKAALQGVVKSGPDELAWIARVRLAGVMLDDNQAQEALTVLSGSAPKALAPLVNDRKGDVLAALGRKDEARSAWKLASEEFPAQSPSRELVVRKLQTIDSFGDAK